MMSRMTKSGDERIARWVPSSLLLPSLDDFLVAEEVMRNVGSMLLDGDVRFIWQVRNDTYSIFNLLTLICIEFESTWRFLDRWGLTFIDVDKFLTQLLCSGTELSSVIFVSSSAWKSAQNSILLQNRA